jgi:hypothetical protein
MMMEAAHISETSVNDTVTQKTAIFTLITLRTSNPACHITVYIPYKLQHPPPNIAKLKGTFPF